MKLSPPQRLQTLPATLPPNLEVVTEIWAEWRRQKLPLYLFLGLCFNLVVAPVVYATSSSALSRPQAWALGVLGLGTVALAIYLFFVMFAPERF